MQSTGTAYRCGHFRKSRPNVLGIAEAAAFHRMAWNAGTERPHYWTGHSL